ncbi:MAG: carbohydrate kinase family protein [Thermotogota bacterium]
MNKVLLLGEALIDFLSEDYSESLLQVQNFSRHAGGSPANITANLLNLGEEAIFITRIGNDPFGDFLKKTFSEKRIDTTYVQVDEDRNTSLVFVAKSKGNPKFLPFRSADYCTERPGDIKQILKQTAYFHISSWSISHNPSRNTVFSIMDDIEGTNTKLCFDPNFRKILWEKDEDPMQTLSKVLQNTYLCKPSDDDAFHIFGRMNNEEYVRAFHKMGAQNVILTMGREGALVSNGQKTVHQKTVSQVVVDTTGAGDGFWSGVYCGILNDQDIFTAARWGSAVAAFRLRTIGSDLPLPSMEVIKSEFLM